jgi:DNA-binding NtrC family response regulator
MPATEGRDLIGALREIDPAVPVVGVAGKSETPSAAECAPGVILPKPFAADTLLFALGRALELRAAARRDEEGLAASKPGRPQ